MRKLLTLLNRSWRWQFFNDLYLYFVNFNAFIRENMTKDNPLLHHKMALLPIQDQIHIFTSFQDLGQIIQATVIGCTIHRKIIHKDFHYVLNKIRKNNHHTTLKYRRGIS